VPGPDRGRSGEDERSSDGWTGGADGGGADHRDQRQAVQHAQDQPVLATFGGVPVPVDDVGLHSWRAAIRVAGDVLLDDCGGHVSSLLVLAAAIPSAPAKTRPATAGTVEPVAVATNRPAANAAKAVPISTSSTARPSGSCASPTSRSSSRITASVLAGVDAEVAPTLPPGHSGHRQRE